MLSYEWHKKHLELAKHISTWSKDPSTQIGAVIASQTGQILSLGYNGFPRGIADTDDRLNDREQKYQLIVHAEMNAIYNATLNGVSLRDSTLYVHGLPVCKACALGIIQVGIKLVVMPELQPMSNTWAESWEKTKQLFTEANVAWMFI
jgi:dCMP deaminase